ncbi:MAG: Na+-driven multidrug efflux pump, partial [Alteromonadaceae bacterium]
MTVQSHNYQWLVHAPVAQVLFRMTCPMVGAIFLLFAYDVLESQLLSHSSLEALTALGFTVPITTAMVAFAVAITITTNTAVTQVISQNKEQTSQVVVNSIVVAVMLSALLTLLAFVFNNEIFSALGIDYAMLPDSFHLGPRPRLMPLIENYMLWRYTGWVFLVLIWQVNSLLRAVGLIGYASGLFVAWMVCKITLALLWFDNLAYWQVSALESAALVHLFTDALFALISMMLLFSKLKINPWDGVKIAPLASIKKMSMPGLSATLQQLFTPISITLLTIMIVTYGQVYVAVLGIIFRLEALLLLIPMVLTTSLPSIVGVNWWSGFGQRVKKVLLQSKLLVVASQLLIAFSLMFYGPQIAQWFSDEQHIQHSIATYLKIVPLGYIGAGISIICQSSFNATGHFFKASFLSFTHRIVLMLGCCYIGLNFNGIEGLFFGILIAHLLSSLLAIALN